MHLSQQQVLGGVLAFLRQFVFRIAFGLTSLSKLNGIVIPLLYVQDVNTLKAVWQSVDLQKAIAATQHFYCLNSLPCSWNTHVFEQINVSSMDNIWEDQIELEQNFCCKPCSCFSCMTDGDCCPDVFSTFGHFSQANHLQKSFCQPLQLKPRSSSKDVKTYPNSGFSVKMYTKCPDLLLDEGPKINERTRLKQMCETENSQDIESVLPVTNRLTYQVFKNKFCAECYGLKDQIDFWDANIVCHDSTFNPTDINKVVTNVLETENCNIIFSSEHWMEKADFCEDLISKCNVTGKWKTFDPVIEKACSAYTASYQEKYRNIFCYMCNGEIMSSEYCSPFGVGYTKLTFALVLDYKYAELGDATDKSEDTQNCIGHTVYDVLQESCIEVSCMEPTIYLHESCVNFATKIGGVGYRVFLQLQPLSGNMADETGDLEAYFLRWLKISGLESFIYTFSIHVRRHCDAAALGVGAVNFVVYFEFYFSPMFPENISVIDNVLEMHNNVITIYMNESIDHNMHFYVRLELFNVHTVNETDIFLTQWDMKDARTLKLEKRFIKEYQEANIAGLSLFNKDDIRTLLPTYNCPLVTLSSSFYDIRHFTWGVSIGRSKSMLNRSEYNVKENGGTTDIRICKHTFDTITEKILAISSSSANRLHTKFHIHLICCILLMHFVIRRYCISFNQKH